jgi:hypothetical protein
LATRPIESCFFDPQKFEKRLREFVIDYEPHELYDKLGLPRPAVTQVTQVTDPTRPTIPLDTFLDKTGKDRGCAGSVTCVTSVTEKGEERHG